MRVLFSIFVLFGVSSAFAGQDCKSADGKTTLVVSNYWLTGPSATFKSEEVTAHYAKIGLKVDVLETARDPQTGKFVAEQRKNDKGEPVLLFLQGGKSSSTAWGLEFNLRTNETILRDQMGTAFVYSMQCQSTPDLE